MNEPDALAILSDQALHRSDAGTFPPRLDAPDDVVDAARLELPTSLSPVPGTGVSA